MFGYQCFHPIKCDVRQCRGDYSALGCPLVGHVEHILFYHSRLKPLAEHFLVDYDIVKQPFVADMVEASLYVTLKHPLSRGLLVKALVYLVCRIRT